MKKVAICIIFGTLHKTPNINLCKLYNMTMRKHIITSMLLIALAFGFATTTFAAQYHIVKKGDTMWKISQQYNVPFAEVLKLNSNYKNPDLIYIGDKIAIPTTSTNTGESESQVSSEAEAVLKLVNEERTKQGLSKLTLSTKLNEIAYAKSKDMAVNNYFSHNSPTYGTPFQMLKKFGISYKSAGENIAAGQKTPEEVMRSWLNSSGHRANILNKNYTELGVGYYKGGSYGTYWTQTFIGE